MSAPASSLIKWSYAIVVIGVTLPFGLANSGWVAIAKGGGALAGVPLIGPLFFFVIGAYRVYCVAKVPGTLDAPGVTGFGRMLRTVGVVFLAVGAVVSVLNLISIPLMLVLLPKYNGETPVYFIVGIYLATLVSLGLLGLLLFEFSRLLSFENLYANKTPDHTSGGQEPAGQVMPLPTNAAQRGK